jgi:hypothetical protein
MSHSEALNTIDKLETLGEDVFSLKTKGGGARLEENRRLLAAKLETLGVIKCSMCPDAAHMFKFSQCGRADPGAIQRWYCMGCTASWTKPADAIRHARGGCGGSPDGQLEKVKVARTANLLGGMPQRNEQQRANTRLEILCRVLGNNNREAKPHPGRNRLSAEEAAQRKWRSGAEHGRVKISTCDGDEERPKSLGHMPPLVAGVVRGDDGVARLSYDAPQCVLQYGSIPTSWTGTIDEFFEEQQRHLADLYYRGWEREAVASLLAANPYTDDVDSIFGDGHAISNRYGADGTMGWDEASALWSFVEIDPYGSPLPEPRCGMVVQAWAREDNRWYNATITEVTDMAAEGTLTIEWTTNNDEHLRAAPWFTDASAGTGSLLRRVKADGEVRRRLATVDKRWGVVVRVVGADPSRVLYVQLLEPLEASKHKPFSGDALFEGMVVEDQQFQLSDIVVQVQDSDVYVLNVGDIFAHDRNRNKKSGGIYHGVENLEEQSVARVRAVEVGLAAQRAIRARRLPAGDDRTRDEGRVGTLRERWVQFVPDPVSPFSDWWKVGLVNAATKEPFIPRCGPCSGTSAKACDIVQVESQHGRDAQHVHPRILTREMPRPFVLVNCHCKAHDTTFSPIDDYACDNLLDDPDSVIVGAFAQAGSHQNLGKPTVHEVLFTRNAQRLAWDSTAIQLLRTEWSKSHSYRAIQRAIADSWAAAINAKWPLFLATLAPEELDDAAELIDEIRGHLQTHLPSLESIKTMLLTLDVVLDQPFAESLSNAWIGVAGTVCQFDVGHTGTQVISMRERGPDYY